MNEENEEKGNVFAPFRPKHFKRSMPEKMAILSRTSVDIRYDINLTAPPVLACYPSLSAMLHVHNSFLNLLVNICRFVTNEHKETYLHVILTYSDSLLHCYGVQMPS